MIDRNCVHLWRDLLVKLISLCQFQIATMNDSEMKAGFEHPILQIVKIKMNCPNGDIAIHRVTFLIVVQHMVLKKGQIYDNE